MTTAQSWTFEDTFENWLTKYNEFVELNKSEIKFRYLPESSNGLSNTFSAGQVRNGSTVEDLASQTLVFPANSSIVVGIYKQQDQLNTNYPSVIAAYTLGNVPDHFFIPIYAFTTNANSVTATKDMRTPFSYGSNDGSGNDSAVLMFNQHIAQDVTILPLKNGLSVGPTVDQGFTVTVSDGSEWAVI